MIISSGPHVATGTLPIFSAGACLSRPTSHRTAGTGTTGDGLPMSRIHCEEAAHGQLDCHRTQDAFHSRGDSDEQHCRWMLCGCLLPGRS